MNIEKINIEIKTIESEKGNYMNYNDCENIVAVLNILKDKINEIIDEQKLK